MKYYQDIEPGDTLRAIETLRAQLSNDKTAYRRAVVALQQQLATLQSQPRLQPVTPEAMAELEGEEIRTIAVLSQGSAKTMTWNTRLRQWHSRAGHDNPLEWLWFIELSTIPEVQR